MNPNDARTTLLRETMGISNVRFAAIDRTTARTDPLSDGAAFAHAWVETSLGRPQELAA